MFAGDYKYFLFVWLCRGVYHAVVVHVLRTKSGRVFWGIQTTIAAFVDQFKRLLELMVKGSVLNIYKTIQTKFLLNDWDNHHAWVIQCVFIKLQKFSLKGALDKFNIIPQLFPKKVGIFIPLEVLAWVMTACWVLHSRLT